MIQIFAEQTETFWSLLHNAAHWEFELFIELLTAIPTYFIGRYFVKRHDRKEHKK